MPPRLGGLPSQLGSLPIDAAGQERQRTAFNPLRALYRTARWARLRWSILARDMFTCQMCGRIEGDTSKLVCDHRQPHRGDLTLFWDEDNLQCLCAPCHSGAKQRLEQGAEHR
jgi:5-methylcytosine-specific restriction endonuclease McrA